MLPPDSPPAFTRILAALSLAILAAGVVVGAGLSILEMLQPSGGWFAGMGYVLGLMALAAGNLLSWLLNAICRALGDRRKWLCTLLAAQTLPALLCLGYGGVELWGMRQDGQALERGAAVREAVRRDDVAALDAALGHCDAACQGTANARPDALLLLAADAGAPRAAQRLVAQGAKVSWGLNAPGMDLRSCEGLYLPGVNALGVAAARKDDAMLRLLLAASDEDGRYAALRTAAALDRLDAFEALLAAGVSLPRGAPFDGPHDHLLAVAASGASIQVARRLLAAPPAPVTPAVAQAALAALFRFMNDTDGQPRAVEFARLLTAPGADIDAPYQGEASLLAEAVRVKRKDVATLLLQAGASRARLPRERREALQALLAGPDEAPWHGATGGCVAP
ncbi:hypothetical protein [Herbaspirillum robiniae]|uniref:Ankyrin repeat domain-containing protein n=1 Tax=Herbaspirillum robiniae TaxID=2014887 RepID=A0ABX2M1B9_9BURK|nr:hypothetical protein [Herbaspirillum robiniae]NUU03453.1 hypothetical protein [Herbaspirillum robiniae]